MRRGIASLPATGVQKRISPFRVVQTTERIPTGSGPFMS